MGQGTELAEQHLGTFPGRCRRNGVPRVQCLFTGWVAVADIVDTEQDPDAVIWVWPGFAVTRSQAQLAGLDHPGVVVVFTGDVAGVGQSGHGSRSAAVECDLQADGHLPLATAVGYDCSVVVDPIP